MRLLFVRHGETTWNAEGRYQGRLDTPLSVLGKAQAAALAEHIRSEGVHAVVSSPLSRAAETAAACARALGIGCTLDERLIEVSHGSGKAGYAARSSATIPSATSSGSGPPKRSSFRVAKDWQMCNVGWTRS